MERMIPFVFIHLDRPLEMKNGRRACIYKHLCVFNSLEIWHLKIRFSHSFMHQEIVYFVPETGCWYPMFRLALLQDNIMLGKNICFFMMLLEISLIVSLILLQYLK